MGRDPIGRRAFIADYVSAAATERSVPAKIIIAISYQGPPKKRIAACATGVYTKSEPQIPLQTMLPSPPLCLSTIVLLPANDAIWPGLVRHLSGSSVGVAVKKTLRKSVSCVVPLFYSRRYREGIRRA